MLIKSHPIGRHDSPSGICNINIPNNRISLYVTKAKRYEGSSALIVGVFNNSYSGMQQIVDEQGNRQFEQ